MQHMPVLPVPMRHLQLLFSLSSRPVLRSRRHLRYFAHQATLLLKSGIPLLLSLVSLSSLPSLLPRVLLLSLLQMLKLQHLRWHGSTAARPEAVEQVRQCTLQPRRPFPKACVQVAANDCSYCEQKAHREVHLLTSLARVSLLPTRLLPLTIRYSAPA